MNPNSGIASFDRPLFKYGLFSIAAAIFCGIVIFQILDARKKTEAEAKNAIQNYIDTNVLAIGSAVQAMEISLRDLADDIINSKTFDRNLAQNDLDAHRRNLSLAAEVTLWWFDKDGNLVLSSPQLPKINISDRDHFKALKNDPRYGTYITQPVNSKAEPGTWIVIIARRLTQANGTFAGIISASVPVEFFSRFRQKIELGSDGLYAVVTGPKPHFAFRDPKGKELLGKPFAYHPNIEPVVSGQMQSGVFETISVNDNVHRLTGIGRVPGSNIMIVIGKNYRVVMEAWGRQSFLTLSLLLVVLTGTFLALRFFIEKNQDRVSHQSQMVSSSKLVALGEMAGSIAHEINNPLAIIAGFSRRLKRQMKDGNFKPAEAIDTIENLEKTVARISNVVNALRNFARDPGQGFEKIKIQDVVQETLSISMERFVANQVRVDVDLAKDDIFVNGNHVQLMQIVMNLLNNAFDAVQSMQDRWIRVEVAYRENDVEIAVEDAGRGIPDEIAQRMMEPFFTTKKVGHGTGLGLALSLGIAQSHGGTLRYSLTRQGNTRMALSIPALEQNRSRPTSDSRAKQAS